MASIAQEQVPQGTDQELRSYIDRLIININIALNGVNIHPGRTALPDRPTAGAIYYFSAAISGDPVITAEGFYGYISTGYVAL